MIKQAVESQHLKFLYNKRHINLRIIKTISTFAKKIIRYETIIY
jgi:hypothetical protein